MDSELRLRILVFLVSYATAALGAILFWAGMRFERWRTQRQEEWPQVSLQELFEEASVGQAAYTGVAGSPPAR